MNSCPACVLLNMVVDEPRENARLKFRKELPYVVGLSLVGRLIEEITQLLRVLASHLRQIKHTAEQQ